MKHFLFLGAAIMVAQPATAAKFELKLEAAPEQAQRMENGVAAVDSRVGSSSVRLIQSEEPVNKRGTVQILVLNESGQPFNMGSENIRVRLGDGSAVAVIPYEQLLKEQKNRQKWASIAAGLGALGRSMDASNAGFVSGTAMYGGSTAGMIGSTSFNSTSMGMVSVSGYDSGRAYAAEAAARAENQRSFDRLAAANRTQRQALKAFMRTSTVDPGGVHGGLVTFELPKEARGSKADLPITFVVTIGGEEHSFRAVLARH